MSAASGTLLFKLTPLIVVGLFAFGAAMALYFKYRDPGRYELIGRIVRYRVEQLCGNLDEKVPTPVLDIKRRNVARKFLGIF